MEKSCTTHSLDMQYAIIYVTQKTGIKLKQFIPDYKSGKQYIDTVAMCRNVTWGTEVKIICVATNVMCRCGGVYTTWQLS